MTDLALPNRPFFTKMTRPRRFFWWLASDLRAALALVVLLGLVIVAIGAPWIAPYPPTAQDVNNMLAAPSSSHLLGTDDLGRDIFSRLIYGAPATVYASLLAVGVAVAIGLPVGLIAGFFGGWTDDIIRRVIDTFLSFPPIVLAIAVTGDLGIGQGGLSQRKHASRVASITQVGARDVPQGVLPQQRTAIGPEITDLGLLRGTRSAGQGTLGSLQGINGWRCPDCLATAR